jgi:hypothetical protein
VPDMESAAAKMPCHCCAANPQHTTDGNFRRSFITALPGAQAGARDRRRKHDGMGTPPLHAALGATAVLGVERRPVAWTRASGWAREGSLGGMPREASGTAGWGMLGDGFQTGLQTLIRFPRQVVSRLCLSWAVWAVTISCRARRVGRESRACLNEGVWAWSTPHRTCSSWGWFLCPTRFQQTPG